MTGIVISPVVAMYLVESLGLLRDYIAKHECPPSIDPVDFLLSKAEIVADLDIRIAQLEFAIRSCDEQKQGASSNDN